MVRFKNRYICFEVLQHNQCNALGGVGKTSSDQRQHEFILSTRNINSLVREQVKLNFGDLGAGHIASGFQVKYFSSQTRMGIIKVPRDHCQMVTTALTLATHINRYPCVVRVWHVSGTIKKCQKAAIRTDRELIIAWYRKQQAIAKAGAGPVAGDSSLAAMLKESQSQISSLEL
ncbi:RNA-binding protein pop5 [Kickxella alabastrina]|uniref:RNA-binding protein pop5 n=1 Tax=Kickxella alabastrina TaxID=61397 RepID=A0ACC1IJB6_9FUNG|nr:RNA-binding protein pop5 [Kickxella alabastrina]